MKNLLIGIISLLALYGHAQTGKFSLALTQNNNFAPECDMEYIGAGGGLQLAWKMAPRLELAGGLNFNRERTQIVITSSYHDDDFPSGAIRGFVITKSANSLEIPLELRFNVLQKQKWNLQLHLGTRQRITLTELVIPQQVSISTVNPVDFASFPLNGVLPEPFLENEIEHMFDEPRYQAKGYDGFDAYFGIGANYQLSNNWSITLSSTGQFLETKKETIIENNADQTVNWQLWTSIEEIRLNFGLVRHF